MPNASARGSKTPPDDRRIGLQEVERSAFNIVNGLETLTKLYAAKP